MPTDQLASLKKAFFDRAEVKRFLDRKTWKVLSKFGAYVRRRARTSMRTPGKKAYRGGKTPVSAPGSPPFAHAGGRKLLRRLIEFGFESDRRTVLIGPYRLGRTADQHVPRVLEQGGAIAREVRPGVRKMSRYRARPFMRPAFLKEIGWVAAEYRKPLSAI